MDHPEIDADVTTVETETVRAVMVRFEPWERRIIVWTRLPDGRWVHHDVHRELPELPPHPDAPGLIPVPCIVAGGDTGSEAGLYVTAYTPDGRRYHARCDELHEWENVGKWYETCINEDFPVEKDGQ